MEIRTGARDALEQMACDFVVTRLTAALSREPRAALALPGGRSVAGLLTKLTDADLPWERVHLFLADERFVPAESPDRNFAEIDALFVTPLVQSNRLPRENAHPFRYDPSVPDGGAGAYSAGFTRVSAAFDVVVLGAGEDGHVASLFPDHPSIRSAESGYIRVDGSPKPPPARMSASPAMIRAAASALLLFYGSGKAEAFGRFSSGVPAEACPARLVAEIEDSLVLSDSV